MHFVYTGCFYNYNRHEDQLRSMILNGMKKHKIKSVMWTSINLYKQNLITKEEMDRYCKGEEYEMYLFSSRRDKDLVNQDLESLFRNIRLGKELDEYRWSYFLPKLTEEELELVERRDRSFLQTFSQPNPDMAKFHMRFSESEGRWIPSKSDSIYVYGLARRRTFVIQNSYENSSEKESCLKNCCNCS